MTDKQKRNKRKTACTALFFLFLTPFFTVLSACTEKKQKENLNRELPPALIDADIVQYTPPPQISDAEKYGAAAVVLGPGYNDPDFSSTLFSYLSSVFGFVSDDGIIEPILYPGMFYVPGTKTPNMNRLISILANKKIRALIFIGAPEGTHYTIAELKKNNIDFPVFSLFSQDDTAATEWACDIVLDTVASYRRTFESSEKEETSINTRGDAAYLTETVIKSIDVYNTAKEEGQTAAFFVQEAFGALYIVHPYNDLETGLKSVNHFLLEKYEQRSITSL